MSAHRQRVRTLVATVTAAGLLVSPVAPLLDARGGAPQTAAKPATTPAAAPRDADGGWPRDYVSAANASMRIFQPQVASWDGQKQLVAYSAVSYSAPGAAKPVLGTVKLEATTAVAVDERLVNF